MAYKNPNGATRKQAMLAAYSLKENFGANQGDIAKVLGCSGATVSSWIKDVRYQKQIHDLSNELASVQQYVENLQEEIRTIEHHEHND